MPWMCGEMSTTKKMSSPIVGNARSELAMLATTAVPLPVWPISNPIGSPMTAAMTRAIREYCRCSPMRVGDAFGAAPVVDAVSQSTMFPIMTAAPPCATG